MSSTRCFLLLLLVCTLRLSYGSRKMDSANKGRSLLASSCQQEVPAGWTFFAGLDSYSADIVNFNPTTNWSALTDACNSLNGCIAVNTNGFLKSSLLNQTRWTRFTTATCQGLLVKDSWPGFTYAAAACFPVSGMSTGGQHTQWWPFTLKQNPDGAASAQMPIQSPQGLAAGYGAKIAVQNPSTVPWHTQLSSVPARLEAGKRYKLNYAVKSDAPAALQVALVQVSNWQVFYIAHPMAMQEWVTHSAPNLSPPETADYLLNFDLALAPANTVFTFDDITLCEQQQPIAASPSSSGQVIAAASTDFETPETMNYVSQVTDPARAVVVVANTTSTANTGSSGAVITVIRPSNVSWHIQLAGQAVQLNADKSYITQLALKQSGADSAAAASNWNKVTWVDAETFVAVAVNSVLPSASYKTYILPSVTPPKDGQYYMTVDCGTAAHGTSLYVDDIKVFEQ